MEQITDILQGLLRAAGVLGAGVLLGAAAFMIWDAVAEKMVHKRIRRQLLARALQNKAFCSEELIREADKLAHDDKESDDAREFAKRVYVIGRNAQAAQAAQQEGKDE